MAADGGWERCPHDLIRSGVSDRAFRLFMLLRLYDGPGGCFPAQATLAREMGGCTDRTVRECVKELRIAGFVATRRKWIPAGDGKRQICEYVLRDSVKVTGTSLPVSGESNRNVASAQSSDRNCTSGLSESDRKSDARLTGTVLPRNLDLRNKTKTRDSSESLDFTLEGEKPEPALKVESLKVRQDRWFAAFWGAFIHRPEDDKGGARREFRRLVKSETTQNLILAACEREREARLAGEPQYRRSAREWLKSENWRETPEAAEPAKTSDPWDDIEPINARRAVQ